MIASTRCTCYTNIVKQHFVVLVLSTTSFLSWYFFSREVSVIPTPSDNILLSLCCLTTIFFRPIFFSRKIITWFLCLRGIEWTNILMLKLKQDKILSLVKYGEIQYKMKLTMTEKVQQWRKYNGKVLLQIKKLELQMEKTSRKSWSVLITTLMNGRSWERG